eukprot:222761-Pelagomonas_calceolata.AAC.1
MPSIGGNLWETLSLMHAAERQAWIFLSFFSLLASYEVGLRGSKLAVVFGGMGCMAQYSLEHDFMK